ncbi:MAG: NHL repeat-containing protein, partial [Planctomycetota bacterium]
MSRILPAFTTWALLASVVPAAETSAVSFTKKPTAARVAAGVEVTFALSAPTDVAVFIEDAAGRAVCHLVAGVLGRNPPPPLKPDSLEQSILWDGKDDSGRQVLSSTLRLGPEGSPSKGKPAGDGRFTVRVAAGMRPEFDSFVLHNPDGCGRVHALAIGPGGRLYVFHAENTANDNMGGHKIKVYTRQGEHLKVLVPFPADIAPEKVKALGVFQTADGDLVPRVHNWETLNFYPDTVGGRGRAMPDATSSPAVDSEGRVYWLVRGPVLCAVDADGGIPYENFLGPTLLKDIKGLRLAGELWQYWKEKPTLAVGSDDKYVYFAGLSAGSGPLPCVFRVSAATRGPAEAFAGRLDRPGREKGLLTAPRGLAVAKGLLYVADPAADRIAVFKEADGSFVGDIKVKSPQSIGV